MMLGFGDRLLSEVKKLALKDVKLKIYAPPERKVSATKSLYPHPAEPRHVVLDMDRRIDFSGSELIQEGQSVLNAP